MSGTYPGIGRYVIRVLDKLPLVREDGKTVLILVSPWYSALRPDGISDDEWCAVMSSMGYPKKTLLPLLCNDGRAWATVELPKSMCSAVICFHDPEGVVCVTPAPGVEARSPNASVLNINSSARDGEPAIKLTLWPRSQPERTFGLPSPGDVAESVRLSSESGRHYATLQLGSSGDRVEIHDADEQLRVWIAPIAPPPGTRFTAALHDDGDVFLHLGIWDGAAPVCPTKIVQTP